MDNHEFIIVLTVLILMFLLFLALVVAAFYIGFCIGDSDSRKGVTAPVKKQHRKRKPPDVELDGYIRELNGLASKLDAYDGRAAVVKKDGDGI